MSHYQQFEPPFEIPDSWEWAQINDISSSILYGVSESAKPQGEYKLLRITDIQDNNVNWDNVPYTDFDNTKASQYILKNGDIVFARTGATVGKSYLVESLPSNSIYASYLIRIRTNEEILSEYLKIFLNHHIIGSKYLKAQLDLVNLMLMVHYWVCYGYLFLHKMNN